MFNHINVRIIQHTHEVFGIPQRLLLFPSNKHKKFEMQKHKDNDSISVKCRYCN
jgi:hypothetical protein